MIVIFKFEPEDHVLKFKHIIRYYEKLMRLKKRNAGCREHGGLKYKDERGVECKNTPARDAGIAESK
jgi:hypothetical protein